MLICKIINGNQAWWFDCLLAVLFCCLGLELALSDKWANVTRQQPLNTVLCFVLQRRVLSLKLDINSIISAFAPTLPASLLACLLSSMSQLCSSLSETDRAIFSLQQCIFWPPSTHFSFSLFDVTVCRCYRLCVCANQNDRWASPLSLSIWWSPLSPTLSHFSCIPNKLLPSPLSLRFVTAFAASLSFSTVQCTAAAAASFHHLLSLPLFTLEHDVVSTAAAAADQVACQLFCLFVCATLLDHLSFPLFHTHRDTNRVVKRVAPSSTRDSLSLECCCCCVSSLLAGHSCRSICCFIFLSLEWWHAPTHYVGLLSVCVCVLTTEWVSGSPFAAHYLSSFLSSELHCVCSSVSAYTELN